MYLCVCVYCNNSQGSHIFCESLDLFCRHEAARGFFQCLSIHFPPQALSLETLKYFFPKPMLDLFPF